MSNSVRGLPNPTAPAQAMSSTERNIESIKRFSKVFLGHGYDRVTKSADKVLELVVEAFSEEDIEVRDYKTFSAIAIDSTHEQAMQAVQNRIQVDVQLPSFNTGVKANFETEREERNERNHLVCACVCLDIARSAFSRTPPLRADLKPWDARVGDSVIRSGHSFTGYQISLQVDVEKETKEGERKIGGGLAGIPWLQGLVKLGLDGDNIKQTLQGRTITKVIITEVIGFGSYRPPIKACLSVSDFGEIQEAIEVINNDFVNRLPEIHRRYHIDSQNDLIPFNKLAPQAGPGEIPRGLSFDVLEEVTRLIANRPIDYSLGSLKDLAEKIKEVVGLDSMRQVLGSLSLVGFLNALYTVFSPTFARQRNLPTADDYCMIIGNTGRGKSTFIGYMLGKVMEKRIVLDEHGEKKAVLVYKFDNDDGVDYPVIGHGTSETKGYGVYVGRTQYRKYEAHGPRKRKTTKGYIDTAGFADRAGPATDICNAMAIKMATQDYRPNRLVAMLGSGAFDDRAKGFFELLETVKRILKNPESKAAWPFILFLINDHTIKIDPLTDRPIDEDYIMNEISSAKRTLVQERDALLPKEGKGMWGRARDFVSWSWGRSSEEKEKISEQLKHLDEETAQKIIQLQENIDILDGLSRNNVIVGDLKNQSTRNRVLKWQGHDSRSGLTSNLFSMENLVGNGYPIFHTVLTSIASYFNGLHLKEQMQIKRIRDLIVRGRQLVSERNSLEATTAGGEFMELKRECEEKLKSEIDELEKLKGSKKKKAQELASLELDKIEPYDPIRPNTPIQPRNFISFVDAWAKTYQFEYSGVPLEDVSYVEPTKNIKSPGVFLKKDESQLKGGKFSAVYRPAWFNYDRDAEAKVLTWIKSGNRPAVQQKKANFEKELGQKQPDEKDTTSIRAQIRDTKSRIEGLRENIRNYEKAIANGKKGKEDADKRIKEIGEQLQELENRKPSLLDELDIIRKELCAYQEFCQLISQIISELGLADSGQKIERQNFESFVRNFENREKISTYVSPSSIPEEVRTNYFGLEPASGYFEEGNSLFEAISFYSARSAAELRGMAIDCIKENQQLQNLIKAKIGKEDLQVLIPRPEESNEPDDFMEETFSSVEEYLQKMSKDKTWGTDVECRALAQLLGQPIYLLTRGNQFDQVFEKQLPGEPIFLETDGSHYRALTCEIGKEKGMAQVILRQIKKKK